MFKSFDNYFRYSKTFCNISKFYQCFNGTNLPFNRVLMNYCTLTKCQNIVFPNVHHCDLSSWTAARIRWQQLHTSQCRQKVEENKGQKVERKAAKKASQQGEQASLGFEAGVDGASKYYKSRLQQLERRKAAGETISPHISDLADTVTPLADFVQQFTRLQPGECLPNHLLTVTGRVTAIRDASSKLRFIDIKKKDTTFLGKEEKLQVVANLKFYSDQSSFFPDCERVCRGDYIAVRGAPLRTKAGELSIRAQGVTVLSPCMRMLPSPHIGIVNQEMRYRNRSLDLMVNSLSVDKLIIVQRITSCIKEFLVKRNFLEVRTPILEKIEGGASATPFGTYHNEMKQKLFLRISPELNLKKLIIGGLDRIFEIGPQFRNEGIDRTHIPEFTTCEFYMTDADYNDLIDLTETMLSGIVTSMFGESKVKYQPDGPDGETWEIDYSPPYRRVSIIPELERVLNIQFPDPTELHTESSRQFLCNLCEEHNVVCSSPRTSARLLDKLVGKFIEQECISPTFIMDHPEIMSPLAKSHRSLPGLVERFELVVGKMEICDAYTEENDLMEQKLRFAQQAKDREMGDCETQVLNEEYCDAMKLGMPPTAGWGMGIERLAMLLTNSTNIREVIAFPIMKSLSKTEQ